MRVLGRAAVLVALGVVAVSPRARAQSVVVGPLPGSMSALPGASITVPVVADLTSSGGASLGSIAARLTWNPGTLAYVSSSMGTLGSPAVNVDSASGSLRFALANASGATGMPVLINVTFSVTGAPADTTILGLTVSEITAAGTFADLTPITTGAHFCTSTGLWGDVDGDGVFTGHDALIMLTYAVGLSIAPYSVVNGDADGSGAVDSRDALIVLSAAVGIPVTQFRIGHINSGMCSLRTADSVQIQPRTPTVAPGDSLPVTAVVKDSTGAVVQGVGLVWQSKDPTIMRPGAGGSLIAMAPGSTYALVYVQPGVKDSVLVTVTSVRHQWYVNPAAAAANLGVELGSQLYPYASIDTAVAHAAANDTVHVAVADYGPVHITKPVTLLGDYSTTAGFPRLASTTASPTSPALRVDPVLVGAVTIHGLRLVNSQKGLVADSVQTLVLDSVSIEGSRDLGLRVYGADSVMLSHISVIGAVGEGIELDSMRTAALDHVRGDAIASAQGAGGPSLALRIAQVGTVNGDSVTLGSAGAFVDGAGVVTLRRMRVANSAGPALVVNANAISVVAGDFSGATAGGGTSSTYTVALNAGGALEGPPQGSIRFDSSRVHNNGLWGLALNGGATVSLRADTVAGNHSGLEDPSSAIYDFGRLSLAQSAFIGSGGGNVVIEGSGADTVTADTTVFDGTEAYVYDVAAFLMHGGAVRNGAYPPMLDVESAPAVELDSIEASGSRSVYGSGPAVGIYDADTVTVNGLNAHDNWPAALEVQYGAALRVNGGMMLNNGGPYTGTSRATLSAYYVGDTRVYGLTLRDSADVGLLITPTGTSRTVVDSSFLEGSGTLIQDIHCCSVSQDTLIVSRSSLTGFGGTSRYGVEAEYLVKLAVTGSFMDSLWNDAVYSYGGVTTIASFNTIRAWGNNGIEHYTGVLTADSNSFAACTPDGWAVFASQPGTTMVIGNTMTGCGSLLYLTGQYGYSGPDVRVLGDTVLSDSSTSPAITLQEGLGYVQVAGNSITGGTSGGILVGLSYYNYYTGVYNADTARVDSNTVQQTRGDGIRLNNVNRGVSLRYNLASDNQGYGLFSYVPFVAESNTVARNIGGVGDSTTYMSFFRNGNIVGNKHWGAATFNSTLWADGSWWGDSLGPSCLEVCRQGSKGDSIFGFVEYSPVDSLGQVLGAPSIPIPPGAPPVRRALASRAASVPRAPKAPAGVVERPHGAEAAARAAVRQAASAVPRPVRPTGRPTGHRRPAWKTGVPR